MPHDLLPPSARELAELIGLEAALRVCERFGGLRPYLPGNPDAGNPIFDNLMALIGETAAVTLCEHYGGDFLELPRCSAWARAARDAAIADQDRPVDEIARANGLTRRRVFQIRARIRSSAESAQGDLFNEG